MKQKTIIGIAVISLVMITNQPNLLAKKDKDKKADTMQSMQVVLPDVKTEAPVPMEEPKKVEAPKAVKVAPDMTHAAADFAEIKKQEGSISELQKKMDGEIGALRKIQDQFSQKYGVNVTKLQLGLVKYDESKKTFIEMEE